VEVLLRIRLDIQVHDVFGFKYPGAKYRLYLNEYLLIERFYPNDLKPNEMLEENVFLNLENKRYEINIENLTNNRVIITDVAVDNTVTRNINDFTYSFEIQ
jgi:hypothetical protein